MNTTRILLHTFGESVTARELQLADITQDDFFRLYGAAISLSIMIGNGQVTPSVEGDEAADEELTGFAKLLDELWAKYSKPAPIDPDFVRRRADEVQARRDEEVAADGGPQSSVVNDVTTAQRADHESGDLFRFHVPPALLAKPEVAEAMAEANRLLNLHGDDDPRAIEAIIRAVKLVDPGLLDRVLAECGIKLPVATHVNDAGEPVYSVDRVAQALNVDPDDVAEKVAEMADALGQPLEPSSPRRIQ